MASFNNWSRRDFGKLVAVGVAGTIMSPIRTWAQDYPSKPVEMLVGWPPGGVSDTCARLFANHAGTNFGSVVIENKPGATGSIAARHVARAKPDGYTLLFAANPEICINQFITGDTSFDPAADLTPVAPVYTTTHALVVPYDSVHGTLAELLDAARAAPDTIRFASNGTGAPSHLAGEALATEAGVKMRHIPFAGGAPAVTAVMGGHVECCIISISTARPGIDGKSLRVLAVTSQERVLQLPNTPTVREVLGIEKFDFPVFAGIFAPAGISRDRLDAIHAVAEKAMKSQDVVTLFKKNDLNHPIMTPDEYSEFIRDQIALSGSLIRKLGLAKEL